MRLRGIRPGSGKVLEDNGSVPRCPLGRLEATWKAKVQRTIALANVLGVWRVEVQCTFAHGMENGSNSAKHCRLRQVPHWRKQKVSGRPPKSADGGFEGAWRAAVQSTIARANVLGSVEGESAKHFRPWEGKWKRQCKALSPEARTTLEIGESGRATIRGDGR